MDKYITWLKWALAALLGLASGLLGGFDNGLKLYVALMAMDFSLGLAKGWKRQELSSAIARWGFINKLITVAVIAICVIFDDVMGSTGFIRGTAIVWFSISEGISVCENLVSLGVPFPDGILEILIQTKKGFSINITQIVRQIINSYNTEKGEEE